MDLTGNIFFPGPAGRMEAILKEPDQPSGRAAIICHPHPLFGGTMHNKVVYRMAKEFLDAGFAAIRQSISSRRNTRALRYGLRVFLSARK
jgi:alpha/beta superfamily hydrolase